MCKCQGVLKCNATWFSLHVFNLFHLTFPPIPETNMVYVVIAVIKCFHCVYFYKQYGHFIQVCGKICTFPTYKPQTLFIKLKLFGCSNYVGYVPAETIIIVWLKLILKQIMKSSMNFSYVCHKAWYLCSIADKKNISCWADYYFSPKNILICLHAASSKKVQVGRRCVLTDWNRANSKSRRGVSDVFDRQSMKNNEFLEKSFVR